MYKIRGERRVEGLVEGVPDSSKQMHHKQMNGSMALKVGRGHEYFCFLMSKMHWGP